MITVTATITAAATKYCPRCTTAKPLEAFNRDRRSRDGRRWQCRECERDYYAANKEKVRARQRAYRELNREQLLERQRAYREANHEQLRESGRTYRERNAARTPEEVAAKRAELRPNGVKHCRGQCQMWLPFASFAVSRSKADGLQDICRECDGTELLKIMRKRDNWEDLGGCTYCGAPFESVDHVIPREAGGKDTPENLVPACKSCNSSKQDRPLFTFLEQLYPDVDLHEAFSVFTVQIMPASQE